MLYSKAIVAPIEAAAFSFLAPRQNHEPSFSGSAAIPPRHVMPIQVAMLHQDGVYGPIAFIHDG
jgi:hypothetical protein